jgi:hypothetical protein
VCKEQQPRQQPGTHASRPSRVRRCPLALPCQQQLRPLRRRPLGCRIVPRSRGRHKCLFPRRIRLCQPSPVKISVTVQANRCSLLPSKTCPTLTAELWWFSLTRCVRSAEERTPCPCRQQQRNACKCAYSSAPPTCLARASCCRACASRAASSCADSAAASLAFAAVAAACSSTDCVREAQTEGWGLTSADPEHC